MSLGIKKNERQQHSRQVFPSSRGYILASAAFASCRRCGTLVLLLKYYSELYNYTQLHFVSAEQVFHHTIELKKANRTWCAATG